MAASRQATIGELLAEARASLKQALTLDDREAGLEAHILLGHALAKPRAYLIAHRDDPVDADSLATFRALLSRRLQGEPVAYLLGEREFFGLSFWVSPDVLIPRPETELLVELALAHIPEQTACDVLDLGTGSGAVAIAIASRRPSARVTAIDQSAQAVAMAQRNAGRIGTGNIQFLQGNWFAPLASDRRFDLIVGNPPYIAEHDAHLSQGDLRFEPRSALASGQDGLEAIRAITDTAPRFLKAGGRLFLEHGFGQGPACRRLFVERGFQNVSTHVDLAGLERVTEGTRAGAAT